MSRPRLYVHVGLQKTGTSYLQSVFWASTAQLAAQGLDLVPATVRDTFWLMLDVRGRYDPDLDPAGVAGALDRFPGQLAASAAPRALLTEESLAPATDEQINRLISAAASHEVHVVVTVRDLSRQIPSSWQQRLQAGSDEPLAAYLKRLRRTYDDETSGAWRQKDVAGVLERWGRHVPPERIHVVTVPPAGSDPDLLLERFCRVLEVDPEPLDTSSPRPNEALGHVAAEVLRRVNAGIDQDLRKRRALYGPVGKRWFSREVLDGQAGQRVRMPAELEPWLREVSQQQVDALRAGGYDLVGDLDDLLPDPDAFTTDDPEASDAEVAAEATRALAAVLTARLEGKRDQKKRARGRDTDHEGGVLDRLKDKLRSGS